MVCKLISGRSCWYWTASIAGDFVVTVSGDLDSFEFTFAGKKADEFLGCTGWDGRGYDTGYLKFRGACYAEAASPGSLVRISFAHGRRGTTSYTINYINFASWWRQGPKIVEDNSGIPVDVRSEGWYSHYRHSVFQTIGNALVMGAKAIKLVQVKPPPQCERTSEELPALMQDIYDAHRRGHHPFCDAEGRERIPATSVTISQDSIDDLAGMLEVYSQGERCAILASCAEVHFERVQQVIGSHNAKAKASNLMQALVGYSTARDMYANERRGEMPMD